MKIIENDSMNGIVPPPAGDSTRSLQASCDAACSKINDSLYVGGGRVARDQYLLQQSGITHVLNCAGVSCDDYFPHLFQYRTLMLRDTGREDITPYLFSALEFIHSALMSGGKVFVHCVKGISRSPAVAIAYMMWSTNVTLEQAHKRMKTVRPISDPNAGFIFQLREWCELPPSLTLKRGRTLVYRIAGPPSFKITDRAGDAVCSLAASVGPLFVLPPALGGGSVGKTSVGSGDGGGVGSGSVGNVGSVGSVGSGVGIGKSGDGTGGSATAASAGGRDDLCFLVSCASCTWLWHTQSCSLRLLEMARSVARQLQVITRTSVQGIEIVEGGETMAFRAALALLDGRSESDEEVGGSSEEGSSDQEMAGNPQEMSM